MATISKRLTLFQRLAYVLHHEGGLLEDPWDEMIPTGDSSWPTPEHKPLRRTATKSDPASQPVQPVKDKQSSKGVRCRGVWIDLTEDEEGCWLNTPYYVSIHADSLLSDVEGIHRCKTMNDVTSAAALGLLFPDRMQALLFVNRLQYENEMLNNEVEKNVRS